MEVTIENIVKRFGTVFALNGLSGKFPSQTFTCIYGPPGAGKSTLLRIIAGLDFPDNGRITFNEQDVTFASPSERNVSYVAQEFALYPHMNVFQNIAYPLRLKKMEQKKINDTVARVTRFLKIDHLLSRMPAQLSGGEQQRVAIARGLVKETSIYVFDEPLTNLDYKIREDMRGEFWRFQKEFGQTIIYATGDPLEALSLSERVAILNKGSVVEWGETKQVYSQPKSLFAMMHFGFPQANLLQGEVRHDGTFRCRLFSVKCAFDHRPFVGKQVVCAFRPEKVGIVRNDLSGVSFSGRVLLVDVIGSENVVHVRTESDLNVIRVLSARDFRPSLDEVVTLGVAPENLRFYSAEDGVFLGRGGNS